MRVLMVSKAHVVGAYHAKLRELADLGVDLTLIVPPRYGRQRLEIWEADKYTIRVEPCVLDGYNHFHFYRARVGPIDADLVHLDEEPFSLVTYQFLRACVTQRKPVVFFTWQNLYKKYPPPFSYFNHFTFKHVRAGIAGNDEARDVLLARGFSKPITVIPQFGVDPELFCKRNVSARRSKLGLTDKFVVGYVGRMVEEKGIRELIQALVLLPERCVLVLVGSGKFQAGAKQLAEQLEVDPRIHWIPQVSSVDIPQYMNLFDVLVLPSRTTRRWKEQFGRVLIEAMACETPVVGSSSGEIPNVIGETGFVFPEGDVAGLTRYLRRLHDTPGLVAHLGAKGRARVLDRFTNRRIAEETFQFYRQVLEHSGAKVTFSEGCAGARLDQADAKSSS